MAPVTLDLWHTLLYLDPADEDAYMQRQVEIARQTLSEAGPSASSSTDQKFGGAFEEALKFAAGQSELGRTVTQVEQIERAGRAVGRRPDPDRYLERLFQLVRGAPFQLAPRVHEVLGGLRSEGYELAIISNTVGEPGAALRAVLHDVGLSRYFSSMVFSDEQPWSKPSAKIFEKALTDLGATAGASVHVGDGWVDMEGARRAGYRARVLFTGLPRYSERYRALFAAGPKADGPATHQVDSLDQVARVVHEVLPAPRG